ncbi:hypothetical protein [Streptomyces sp900116325]|uniref:hypothetical protein n=1 Tax=Streptomyces sp. 900116325 TaxID=3154295 RepID=UPI00332F1AC4
MKAVGQYMLGVAQVDSSADELRDHVVRANPSSRTSRDSPVAARDLAVPPGIAAAGARGETRVDGTLLSGATPSSGAQLVCDKPEPRTELRRGGRERETTGRSRRAVRIQGRYVGRTLHPWATHMQ